MVATHEIVAEFIGTFILVFTVGCNVLSGQAIWGGVSIACSLMVGIYGLGPVSGANFNPAVSVALGMASSMGLEDFDFPWKKVAVYSMVQIFAAAVAGVVYTGLYWNTFNLQPGLGFGWVNAGLAEFFYTFMLCFVVLNVAVSKKAREAKAQFFGLAIGFVIVAGAYGGGAVSGGCFNPAVAIGIDVASVALGFGICLIYIPFQIAGAAAAAALFKVVRPGDFGGSTESKTPKLVAEFIGTFMLVLTVGLNVLAKSTAGAFSIAASLMCMIYALGDVSGAHFNPAVTVAITAIGKHPTSEVGPYIAAQLLGGVAAAFSYSLIYAGLGFTLAPEPMWASIACAETFFTFVLALVVLSVACSSQDLGHYFGLAIGSCVTVGGCAIGGISGGSLNPAVSFGISASGTLGGHGFGGPLVQALIYTFFEITGGLLASAVFISTHTLQAQPKAVAEEEEALPKKKKKDRASDGMPKAAGSGSGRRVV